MSEGLYSWASREGLSGDIVQVLVDQDFTTLDDLMELGPDDLGDIFQKPQLLKGKQFLALKKAITKLSQGDSPSSPQTSQGNSQWAPKHVQNQDRAQDDFELYGFQHLSVDTNVDSLEMTQPKPGHVKAAMARFSQSSLTPGAAGGRLPSPKPARGFFGGLKEYMFGSSEIREEFRMLMFGKTGSGKSTTGNTILGEKKFASAMMFSSVTTKCDLQNVINKGILIELMDCPGLYDTEKTQEQVSTTIVQAVACMHPGPHAILYIIRLGRYTEEEFGVFNRLKALFDDDITKYMVVVFTGGDDLERENKTLADLLRNVPKELAQVVTECGNRCHVFNNIGKNKKQVDKLLDEVRKMKMANRDQPFYNCPKYVSVGQNLEEEVGRRLAAVTKRDLEREQYVRDLETRTKQAMEDLENMKAEMKRKEEERKRQWEREKKNKEMEEERLLLSLKAKEHELSEEMRIRKEMELRQQLKKDKQELHSQLKRQREEDKQQVTKMEREQEKLEEEKREAKRREQEMKEQAYREEMDRMKKGVANEEEQGWIDWAAGGVAKVVAAPFKAAYNLGSFLFS